MTDRMQTNLDRAAAAAKALADAKTDTDRLAATKALESAACQLRRELRKVLGESK